MSEVIQDNYRAVREKINEACKRVGRKPEEVTLIAVSKTKPLSDIEKLIKIDVIEFGENKPQELRDKFDAVSTPVRFHQIGHLQTNKVKYIINKAVLIHSVDSIKLASVIEKEAEKRNIHVNVLTEVEDYKTHKKKKVPKEKQVIYKDDRIPAIVSEELWDKANLLHEKRKKLPSRHVLNAEEHIKKYKYSCKSPNRS